MELETLIHFSAAQIQLDNTISGLKGIIFRALLQS